MSRIVIPNALANGFAISAAFNLPELRAELMDETVYEVLIESVTGGPATASLAAKFQRWMPLGGGGADVAEQGGQWIDLTNGDIRHEMAGSVDLTASVKQVFDYEFGETAGAAATVLLRTGGVGGAVVRQISLPAGASFGEKFDRDLPLDVSDLGLYVQVSAGAARGMVRGGLQNLRPFLPMGDWPIALTANAAAANVLISRTIKGVPRHRLVLTPTFTGGAAPAFIVSVMTYMRG